MEPQWEKIWGYRLLVSNDNVPLWNEYSIRGIAYQSDLYTKLNYDEKETDEIERWLEKEYETPAEEALDKATNNRQLTPKDWDRLILFVAAQCVRTPAQLAKTMDRWRVELPGFLDTTLKDIVSKLEKAIQDKEPIQASSIDNENIFPMRITREPSFEQGQTLLKVETLVGRGMWLFGIKHILTKTAKVLLKHKWSIMYPSDLEWITNDDPVICLNYYKKGSYDFGGGWENKGSEILLPISPNHMLYTMVGKKNPPRFEASKEMSLDLQKLIAEHAYRWIFSKEPLKNIELLRPRAIDPIAFNHEKDTWENWNQEQILAERSLKNKNK